MEPAGSCQGHDGLIATARWNSLDFSENSSLFSAAMWRCRKRLYISKA
jgi:hypothetical protein